MLSTKEGGESDVFREDFNLLVKLRGREEGVRVAMSLARTLVEGVLVRFSERREGVSSWSGMSSALLGLSSRAVADRLREEGVAAPERGVAPLRGWRASTLRCVFGVVGAVNMLSRKV